MRDWTMEKGPLGTLSKRIIEKLDNGPNKMMSVSIVLEVIGVRGSRKGGCWKFSI